jgi:hypothetical protein
VKEKDLEALADAVKKENERLKALCCPSYLASLRLSRFVVKILNFSIVNSGSAAGIETDTSSGTINNLDGIDWDRIAERVGFFHVLEISAHPSLLQISDTSSVKRNATECRVAWAANRPCVNRAPWTPSELRQLHSLISGYPPNKVSWAEVAEKLGVSLQPTAMLTSFLESDVQTNRIPLDCMRQEIYLQRHHWTPDADQRLMEAVETYGIDNWHLGIRNSIITTYFAFLIFPKLPEKWMNMSPLLNVKPDGVKLSILV